jgi:uncharacterized protein (DUF433 family)
MSFTLRIQPEAETDRASLREAIMPDDSRLILDNPGEPEATAFFTGTVVPVRTLFEYLAVGKSLDQFMTDFPFISREQVRIALDQIAYGDAKDTEPPRPVFRWLFGAFVSPIAVALVYLLWTGWVRYPYRDVADYVALALGIGIGVLCLCLLPIPWWVRIVLSVVYSTAICYVAWWLYMFALTAHAWP